MVSHRRFALALAMLASSEPAAAQTLDWARAGGALFVTLSPAAAPDNPAAPIPAAPTPVAASPTPPLTDEVQAAARRRGLDPRLLTALVAVESGFQPRAVSPAGAAGLTQLMPGTADQLGVADRFDVRESLDAGAEFLARQVVRFGNLRLALAAYNAGPEVVARLGRIPHIPETQGFVERVVDCYLALTIGRQVRGARDCPGSGAAP